MVASGRRATRSSLSKLSLLLVAAAVFKLPISVDGGAPTASVLSPVAVPHCSGAGCGVSVAVVLRAFDSDPSPFANLALGRTPVAASSTYTTFVPDRLVDGNADGTAGTTWY
jgi:hypothetical protein